MTAQAIDDDQIRDALKRLLASEAFLASPQLSAFLRFIVEETLEGRAGGLKGYTIATVALGRPDSFDPQSDPIVRVEATRLRRALAHHYDQKDVTDPVEIVLGKGSYVPRFVRRDLSHSMVETDIPAEPLLPSSNWSQPVWQRPAALWDRSMVVPVFVAGALLLAIAVAVFSLADPWRSAVPEPAPTLATAVADGVTGATPPARPVVEDQSYLPVVRVERFQMIGKPTDGGLDASSFVLRLRDALARFDEITVVNSIASSGPLSRRVRSVADLSTLPLAPTVDASSYIVGGWIEDAGDGTFSLSASLVAARNRRLVWSREFDNITLSADPADTETELVRLIATSLAQPYGVILSDVRSHYLRGGALPPRLVCLIQTFEYWRSFTERDHLKARNCLEDALKADPAFALGYASLAGLELETYRNGYNDRAGEPPLDRAFDAVRKAIGLKPQSARVRQAMMDVLYARGDLASALSSGTSALDANPYDTNVMADLGGHRIDMGDPDGGVALLQMAVAFNPGRPPWYDFHLFIAALLKGDKAGAVQIADMINVDSYGPGLIARAVARAATGDLGRAGDAVRMLVTLHPAFGRNTRQALLRYGFAPVVRDKLLAGLAQAGLSATGPTN